MMPDSQESVELLSEPEEQLDRDPLGEDLDEETRAAPTTSDGASGIVFEGASQRGFLARCCSSCRLFMLKAKETWFVQEMVKVIKLALPIGLMFFLQQLIFFISLLLVGHSSEHSKTELDAAALASSLVNVTGISVVVGITSAADTLCPQAYGFKNYRKVGIILQRGVLIAALVCLPIVAVWLNAESILLLLRQPPCVARLTGEFVQIFVLALPPFVVYIMMQKYLQAQSLVWVFVAISILQNVINVVFVLLFIYVADLLIIGTALSLVISNVASPVILITYVWFRGMHKLTWKGWSWESLTEWGLFFKLGVPGLFMLCFEWWTYEISAIVAGTISELQLAVNTVLMQIGTILFAIPLGVGTAAAVRIGNELGAGNPLGAKRASYAALVVQGACAVLILIFFASTRTFIAGIFTSEQDVIDETAKAMIPGAMTFFFDQFQGTFAGILRGCGRQKVGAIMNFVFYYLIGLPVGISLALLTDLGATGMWTGLCVAVILTDITYVGIILTTNWTKLSQLAMKNAADHEKRPATSTEDDDSSERISESSIVSMETDLNEETPPINGEAPPISAISQAYKESEEKEEDMAFCDDDITSEVAPLSVKGAPLISFEDAERVDSKSRLPRLLLKQHSDHFQMKMKLFLTKGSLYVLGLVLVLVGCVLLLSFRHDDVTEMCTLPDYVNYSSSIVHSTNSLQLFSATYSSIPSPTTTVINMATSVVSV